MWPDRLGGVVPREMEPGPLGREGVCDGTADRSSGSVDHRDLVLQYHFWFLSAPVWWNRSGEWAGRSWQTSACRGVICQEHPRRPPRRDPPPGTGAWLAGYFSAATSS